MDDRVLISGVRIACLLGFVYSSFTISWSSLSWMAGLVGSIYLLRPGFAVNFKIKTVSQANPLKGKPNTTEEELPAELLASVDRDISDFVLQDTTNTETLNNFEPLKQNSQCIFAKRAKIWGAPSWDSDHSLEQNMFRSVPYLIKFSHLCTPMGLDGFLYEIPTSQYASDVDEFGRTTKRILQYLSNADPKKRGCMSPLPRIGRRGWVFEFNKLTFFITTFAPFYPDTHSRYSFGCDNAFMLLQPEMSFAQHDIPRDTPETNWDQPKTVRDRIRTAFREAGRPYLIRDTIYYPMAHDTVKPVLDNGEDIVEWWTS